MQKSSSLLLPYYSAQMGSNTLILALYTFLSITISHQIYSTRLQISSNNLHLLLLLQYFIFLLFLSKPVPSLTFYHFILNCLLPVHSLSNLVTPHIHLTYIVWLLPFSLFSFTQHPMLSSIHHRLPH